MKPKKKIIVLETGHLSKTTIAGGDLLMQGMSPYLKNSYQVAVVIPTTALHHWKSKQGILFHTIRSFFFEYNKNVLAIFLTYCWRIIHTIAILRRIKGPFVLYSSTNIFADCIPAYIIIKIRRDIIWIARIHHVVQSPLKREGNFLINITSFLLDRISLSCIKSANLILALNSSLKYQLKQVNYPQAKLFELGGGIDLHFIKKVVPNKNISPYRAVFVGRMHRTKGIFDLPEIWKRVCKNIPDAKLGIIGEISDLKIYQQLENRLIKLNIIKNVDILGFLPKKKQIATVKKSQMLLFTDHEAGFGLAIAESMALGIPVVGYDNGILGIVYKKGFIKVPINDYDRFAKKVIELLTNARLHRQLSKAAKKEGAKFDWEITSKKFIKILHATISSHPIFFHINKH